MGTGTWGGGSSPDTSAPDTSPRPLPGAQVPMTQGNRTCLNQTTVAFEPITALPWAEQAHVWGEQVEPVELRTKGLLSSFFAKKPGHFRGLLGAQSRVSWEALALRTEWPGPTHQALGVQTPPAAGNHLLEKSHLPEAPRTLPPGRALSSPGRTPGWWPWSAPPPSSSWQRYSSRRKTFKVCAGGGGERE